MLYSPTGGADATKLRWAVSPPATSRRSNYVIRDGAGMRLVAAMADVTASTPTPSSRSLPPAKGSSSSCRRSSASATDAGATTTDSMTTELTRLHAHHMTAPRPDGRWPSSPWPGHQAACHFAEEAQQSDVGVTHLEPGERRGTPTAVAAHNREADAVASQPSAPANPGAGE